MSQHLAQQIAREAQDAQILRGYIVRLADCLVEFSEDPGLLSDEFASCWACGRESLNGQHEADCLMERARKLLEECKLCGLVNPKFTGR